MARVKGFYLTLDVTIAAIITFLILTMTVYFMMTVPHSDSAELFSFKRAESMLFTMREDGSLNQVAALYELGLTAEGQGTAISKMREYSKNLKTELVMEIYNQTTMQEMVDQRAISKAVTGRTRTIAVPFRTDSGNYALARLRVAV